MSYKDRINVDLSFGADTKRARDEIRKLQDDINKLMSNKEFDIDFGGSMKSIAALRAQLEKSINMNTGKLDLGLLNKSFKEAGVTLKDYQVSLSKLGPEGRKVFNSLASSIAQADVPLKQTNELLRSMGVTLKNTIKWTISSSVLKGFVGSVQTAYYYAKDLNRSLNNIRIVTGKNTEEMAKFAKEANNAAKALSVTTTDYTNASLIFYQQGLDSEEVKKRTDVTVKMANVTRQSVEDISNELTAVWNNFADGSHSLEYYADAITKLGAATASSSAEITQGLEKFASVANTVGLSYEYATSALATITATTRQSADIVGNALKTLFGRLEGLKLGETLEDGTTLNTYTKALLSVGVNIKDHNEQLKTMDQILDELGDKWKELNQDQKMALAQSVGGVRQYTQLIALMENYDKFKSNVELAQNSAGTLQKQADIYAESWDAAKKRVTAAFESIYDELINSKFFIDLNNKLADTLELVRGITKALGGIPGMLTLLGSIVTKVFDKDIAKGINGFIYNHLGSNENVEKEMKKQAAELLASNSEKFGSKEMVDVYDSMSKLQLALNENANKMNDTQIAITKSLIEQHKQKLNLLEDERNLAIEAENRRREEENKLTGAKNKLYHKLGLTEEERKANDVVFNENKINDRVNQSVKFRTLSFLRPLLEEENGEIKASDVVQTRELFKNEDFSLILQEALDKAQLDAKPDEIIKNSSLGIAYEELLNSLGDLNDKSAINVKNVPEVREKLLDFYEELNKYVPSALDNFFEDLKENFINTREYTSKGQAAIKEAEEQAVNEIEKQIAERIKKQIEKSKFNEQNENTEIANLEKQRQEALKNLDNNEDELKILEQKKNEELELFDKTNPYINKYNTNVFKEKRAIEKEYGKELFSNLGNINDWHNVTQNGMSEFDFNNRLKSINAPFLNQFDDKRREQLEKYITVLNKYIQLLKEIEKEGQNNKEKTEQRDKSRKEIEKKYEEEAKQLKRKNKKNKNKETKKINKEYDEKIQKTHEEFEKARQTMNTPLEADKQKIEEAKKKASEERKKALKEEAQEEIKADEVKTESYLKAIETKLEAEQNFKEEAQEGAKQVAKTEEEIHKIAENYIVDTGAALTGLTSGVFSFSSALQGLKGSFDVLNDSSLSAFDKITSITTSLAFNIPRLEQGFKGIKTFLGGIGNVSKDAVIGLGKLGNSLGLIKDETLEVANKAETAGAAFKTLGAGLGATLGIATAVVATIGLLVFAFNELNNVSPEGELRKSQEASVELEKTLSAAKGELDALTTAFEKFDSANDTFNRAVRGTKQWEEALNDVNTQVLEILNNFPELDKYFERDLENNRYKFTGNEEDILAEKEKQYNMLNMAKIVQDYKTREAQLKNDFSKYKIDENNQLYSFDVDTNDRIYASKEEQKEYEDRLKELEEQRKNINFIAGTNLDPTKYSASAIAMTNSSFEALQKKYEDEVEKYLSKINVFSRATDQDVQDLLKEYSDATGTSYKLDAGNAVIGTDSNRAFKIHTEFGDEHKEVSWDEIKTTIAVSKALAELGDAAGKATKQLTDLRTGEYKDYVNAFESYIANGNFGELTEQQFNDFKKIALNDEGELTEDSARAALEKLWGKSGTDFDNFIKDTFNLDADEYIKNFIDSINQMAQGFDELESKVKGNSELFSQLDRSKLTANEQNQLVELFNDIYARGGKTGQNLLSDITKNMSSDQLKSFLQVTSTVDYFDTNTSALNKQLVNAGVNVENFDEVLSEFIRLMRNGEVDLESYSNKFSEIHNIIDKLKQGNVIDKDAYNKLVDLNKESSDYFTLMLDGTYKLNEDAQKFYDLVQSNLINEASINLKQLNEKRNRVNNLNKNYNIDRLSQSQNISGSGNKYLQGGVAQQLEILDALYEDRGQLEEWKANQFNLSSTDVENIAKAVQEVREQYVNLDATIETLNNQYLELEISILSTADSFDEIKELQEKYKISTEALNAAQNNLLKSLRYEDIDPKEVKELSKYIKEIADDIEEIEDNLSSDSAEDVATQISRINAGLEIGVKNWEDWNEALNSESIEDKAEAYNGFRDVISDITGIQEEYISNDFIKDNLELLKKALDGDKEAIIQLRIALQEPIILKILTENKEILEEEELRPLIAQLQQYLDENELKLGAVFNNEKIIESFGKLIEASKLTVAQCNAIFSAFGFDAKFKSEKKKITHYVPRIKRSSKIDSVNGGPSAIMEGDPDIEYVPVEEWVTAWAINGDITYTGDAGNFSAPPKDTSKGGGSKRKPKDPEKLDRYWNINNAIKKVSNALEKYNAQLQQLQTMQSHLFGQELIDNLKKQNALIGWRNKLLEQQKGNYQKLYVEQSRELDELKKKLTGAGGSFSGDTLTNYASLWNAEYAKYKKAEATYIAGGSEEAWESAQKHWEQIKELIERYQELFYTDMAETQQNLDDIAQQELENKLQILANNLQMWEITVKAKLDLTEAKRNLDKFLKEVEQDFRKVYQDLTIDSKFNAEAFATYKDDIQTTLDAIKDVEAEIDKINAGGESDKFASVSEAQEKLKELQQQLLDQAELLNQMYQEVWNNYIDGLNQVKDKFDDIIKQYERIGDELNYERELVELLYGDKAYDLMNKFYDAQQKNILGQIDSMKQQMSFWESEFKKAYEMNRAEHNVDMNDMSTWTEDMKIAYDNMQDAQSSLNSLILEGVKNLQEDYMNAINKVLNTMDSNVWRMSFDDMKEDWDHIQNLAGEYLDDVEGAYRIQTLANKIDQSIASSLNTKAQQKLQDLREKEIKMLREKENLTQDDIDLAEQRYQIALKEIALEEAQNSKTSMKLTRDTSGNWTYQYVADETDVLKKQQDLLDAYNNLYETADKAYNHAMELAMNTYQEMQEKIREIAEDMTLSEEEKEQKIQAIYDKYLSEIEAAVGNSELYRQEAMMASAAVFSEICEQDEDAYENLTENQKRLVDELKEHNLNNYEEIRSAIVDDLYPSMSEAAEASFGEMNLNSQTAAASVISDWAKDNGTSVRGMLKAALYDLTNQIRIYESELDKLQRIAEVDFDKIGKAIDDTSKKTEDMRDQTQNMCTTAEVYLEQLRTAVDNVASAWAEVIAKIQEAIQALQEYIKTKQEADNQDDSGSDDSDDDNDGGGTGGGGTGGGGTGGNTSKEIKIGDSGTLGWGAVTNDQNGGKPWGTQWVGTKVQVNHIGGVDSTKYGKYYVHVKNGGGDLGWIMPEQLKKFDTGGYTGSWDSSGKLAMLHQKELVLNASDTLNMLKTVEAVRDLSHLNSSIDAAIAGSLSNLVASMIAGRGYSMNTNTNSNSENVFNITAEFPNANDVDSIREAILSLPNLASQYLNEK